MIDLGPTRLEYIYCNESDPVLTIRPPTKRMSHSWYETFKINDEERTPRDKAHTTVPYGIVSILALQGSNYRLPKEN
jgi:hypothetical protein